MEKQIITLTRHNAPDWNFEWSEEHKGLVHKTKDNAYRIFFESISDCCKPIWIGRLCDNAWITWEKELKAKSIHLLGCDIIFNT